MAVYVTAAGWGTTRVLCVQRHVPLSSVVLTAPSVMSRMTSGMTGSMTINEAAKRMCDLDVNELLVKRGEAFAGASN